MSLSLTYAQLVAMIQDWEEDSDSEFTTAIDNIIGLGEDRLLRDLDLEIFNGTATGSFTIASQSVARPSDIIALKTLTYVTAAAKIVNIERKTFDYLDYYWPTVGDSGSPIYYCELDETNFRVVPTPAAALPYTIRYLKRPTGLSSGNTTSWLGSNAGDLLFLACMAESSQYLKEDPSTDGDRIGKFIADYAARLGPAKLELSRMTNTDYKPVAASTAPTK